MVSLHVPENDWAFIPDPLPPNWKFPLRLWPLLSEAKESIARLDGIGRTLPDPELLLQPLQSREALRSSSLEGTYASPQELLLFELHPREPSSNQDPANAWLEVSNYSKALRQGMKFYEQNYLIADIISWQVHDYLTTKYGQNYSLNKAVERNWSKYSGKMVNSALGKIDWFIQLVVT